MNARFPLRRILLAGTIGIPIWVATFLRPAPAEGGIPSPDELKKMSLDQLFQVEVTTVSSKAEPLARVPAAAQVVSGEDIRRMGARSLPEALRYVPGVEVARIDSRQYALTVRGFNGSVANKLLVLIDGRSVYTPLYSGVFWDAQDVFFEDVQQIEVIRGPGATIWGANAVNGVINVITKDASETQGLYLTGGGGEEESGFGGARYGGRLGSNAFFRVYGKGFNREASLMPTTVSAGDAFRMRQGGLRVDRTPPSGSHLTLQGDLYDGAVDQRTARNVQLSGGNARAAWTRPLSARSELSVHAYFDRTERVIPSVFEEALDTYDATLRHRFRPSAHHDLIWGLGYRRTDDDVTNSPTLAFLPAHLDQALYSFFVQDEISLARDRVHVTAGSKLEHNDYTGMEYQPGARLSWSLAERHVIWTAASRAVRMPSRIDRELYSPSTPPYFLAGGPDFESEILRAYELGYRALASRNASISVATYYNQYDKLRSVEMGSPIVLANGIEGHTYGLEASLDCEVRNGWRTGAGATLFRAHLEAEPASNDTVTAKQTGDSPRHQFFIRTSIDFPHGVELDLALRRVAELPNQKVPAYTGCDARVGWWPNRQIEVSVVGQSLLAPSHAEFGLPAQRREIERSLYGRITCRL